MSGSCPLCGGLTELKIEGLFDDRFGYPDLFSIQRCTACAHHFVDPPMQESKMQDLYENYYGRSSAVRLKPSRTVSSRTRRWLLGENNLGHYVLDVRRFPTLLDVGSGDCQNLCDAIEIGFEASGFDVDRASARIGELNNLQVRAAESVDYAYPGQCFSAIQLNQVIEHYPDPLRQLHDLGQHLKEGGRVFISTPNADSIYRRLFRRRWINWHVPYHQHHFTRKSIRLFLERDGWIVDSIKTVTPTIWFMLQLNRFLYRPSRGDASRNWTSPSGRSQRIALLVITGVFLFPIRFLDILGLGDSLVVVASKR